MNACLLSHTGMGDNLFMVGALHYLLNFYEKIYFICKRKYYDNVALFFIDAPNIICVPFNECHSMRDETEEVKCILNTNHHMNDIFICGDCHKSHFKSRITNHKLLHHQHVNKNYTIDFVTINTGNYNFIENFYKDINLTLTQYYDYFYLPTTNEAISLYNSIKDYYIIFIQAKSSDEKTLNISNLLKTHLHNNDTILICNDKNLYDIPQKTPDIEKKFNLCNDFVCNKLIHYTKVIQNSNEIYIIDSCFVGMVLPYLKTNKLKATKVRIIRRDIANTIIL